jgi:hypothetical protein
MSEWVEVTYPVEMGGYYEDGFWADSNTVQQVVSAAANHATVIERERIIKLLSKKLSCSECDMNHFENDISDKAIALIKGEK